MLGYGFDGDEQSKQFACLSDPPCSALPVSLQDNDTVVKVHCCVTPADRRLLAFVFTITKRSASFLHPRSLVREEKFKFWVEPTDGGIHTIQ